MHKTQTQTQTRGPLEFFAREKKMSLSVFLLSFCLPSNQTEGIEREIESFEMMGMWENCKLGETSRSKRK